MATRQLTLKNFPVVEVINAKNFIWCYTTEEFLVRATLFGTSTKASVTFATTQRATSVLLRRM